MNFLGAVVAGIAGTAAISIVMAIAPMMGMPNMDIVGMLSTMFGKPNRMLGWIMHMMMGIIFALIYSFLWSSGIGSLNIGSGLLFGAVHWLLVGLVMGMIPMLHMGIQKGDVAAPGLWMMNAGGAMAFVGGLVGHLVFGLVVALVYPLF
jgi:uncharacterized membrane protein YagU involved in acid resistance